MFVAVARQAVRGRFSTSLRPAVARKVGSSQPFRLPFHRSIVTKKYTQEHEVVTFDDVTGLGTVSITNHAQETLGDIVFIDLPTVGSTISQGDPIGAVESVKAASDIVYYAPVSGEIFEINETLQGEPGLVNRSPEDKGWLCKIKLSVPEEMDGLLTLEKYIESYES